MGKFNTETIKNVMQEINVRYFLPDLQREYVWLSNEKEQKIERLFDSIMRGYPISSFLLWKLKKTDIAIPYDKNQSNDKLNFQLYKFITDYDVQHPHNQQIDISQINCDDLFVVLDGQQRLTSFFIGIRGSRTLKKKYAKTNHVSVEKRLYLNLRNVNQNSEADCMYDFQFLTPEEATQKDEKTNWFRVGEILCFKDIDAEPEERGYSANESKLIRKLHKAVCQEENIVYFAETDKDITKVLNIFIRINSGGMQLSYSDLLMSILTSSFNTDIREKINEEIDNAKNSGYECFGRDQMLKTALFLTGADHKFILKNFDKRNVSEIEKHQNDIFFSVREAMDLMSNMGYKNALSSGYIITVLAYWLYHKKLKCSDIKGDELKAMTEFVRIAQLLSYFTTSLDTKLSNVKEAFAGTKTFRDFLNEMSSFSGKKALRVTIDDIDDFLTFKYGKQNVLPVLQVLYPKLDYSRNIFHIDHIYPQSQFRKLSTNERDKKDYIWNLQLLEGSLNIEKSNKDPDKWVTDTFNDDSKRKQYMIDNYIDENYILSWNNFNDFEEMRKEKIRNKLKEVFNL